MIFSCAHCELEFGPQIPQSVVFEDVCVHCDIEFHEANLETLQNQMKELVANAK